MSTAHPESELQEADPLGILEDRIHRAVELVASLKAERDAALDQLAAAKKAAAEVSALRQELESLRAERKQVRVRIEKLLGQMDQVSGQ
jgi:FtsZ-binding cell division protein ZapB